MISVRGLFLLSLLSTLTLAACGDDTCSRDAAVVCGVQGDLRHTFENECALCEESFELLHAGACENDEPAEPEPCVCADVVEPVCGKARGDDVATLFSSGCEMECAGASLVEASACEPVEPEECVCPDEVGLVCGKNSDGNEQTYPSRCAMECVGAELLYEHECCKCADVYQPQCGIVVELDAIEWFGNMCELECAGAESVDAARCEALDPTPHDCECADVWTPVCGRLAEADGGTTHTFGNACQMECERATLVSEGECRDDPVGCPCIALFAPECGIDGNTYSNACQRECAEVELDHAGACEKPVDPVGCTCIALFAPECGTDGNTYSNACERECADVELDHAGACAVDCTAEYMPVCGVDGETYGNACELTRAGVERAYNGECDQCTCNNVRAQRVCGNDGVTYESPCDALCGGATVEHEGACACACDGNVAPVCAQSGGKALSFNNACEAECEGALVQCDGECPCSTEPPAVCACTKEYRPVCGSDGVTYGNMCTFECATETDAELSLHCASACDECNEADDAPTKVKYLLSLRSGADRSVRLGGAHVVCRDAAGAVSAEQTSNDAGRVSFRRIVTETSEPLHCVASVTDDSEHVATPFTLPVPRDSNKHSQRVVVFVAAEVSFVTRERLAGGGKQPLMGVMVHCTLGDSFTRAESDERGAVTLTLARGRKVACVAEHPDFATQHFKLKPLEAHSTKRIVFAPGTVSK